MSSDLLDIDYTELSVHEIKDEAIKKIRELGLLIPPTEVAVEYLLEFSETFPPHTSVLLSTLSGNKDLVLQASKHNEYTFISSGITSRGFSKYLVMLPDVDFKDNHSNEYEYDQSLSAWQKLKLSFGKRKKKY